MPAKIVYPPEHAYTPAALGFEALKGADAGVVGVLAAAAKDADVDLHLALLTIEESGYAEPVSYGSSYGRWHASDDDFGGRGDRLRCRSRRMAAVGREPVAIFCFVRLKPCPKGVSMALPSS